VVTIFTQVNEVIVVNKIYCLGLFLFFISCYNISDTNFKEIHDKSNIGIVNDDYRKYCNVDINKGNYEINAVLSSFYGAYKNSINLASKNESSKDNPSTNIETPDNVNKDSLIRSFNSLIEDPSTDDILKQQVSRIVKLLDYSDSIEETFKNASRVNAIDFIVENAKSYQFTLINEAHYNSQHRNFTMQLLEPMWDLGYRYLALEALSHYDKELNDRAYPIKGSGYYLKDSNFGNMVRKALALGFQLIAYETQLDNDGSARDFEQAKNILKRTIEKDANAKVLIHAGYSHIIEQGDSSYEPLGYQLKKMTGLDILTIDQIGMISFPDQIKVDHYYRYVDSLNAIIEPIVMLNADGNSIVDLINTGSIDIQVYHPPTIFKYGRPVWQKNKTNDYVKLPNNINESYIDHLVQARYFHEPIDAIPIDQFIIDSDKQLILPKGNFRINLINCKGEIVKEYEFSKKSI